MLQIASGAWPAAASSLPKGMSLATKAWSKPDYFGAKRAACVVCRCSQHTRREHVALRLATSAGRGRQRLYFGHPVVKAGSK
jgi:hypothetical protein